MTWNLQTSTGIGAHRLKGLIMTVTGDYEKKEEISSAATLVQSVVKATKGVVMYRPNNPLYRKFFDESYRKITGHLDRFGGLSLVFDHATISAAGETVYQNDDPRESLAFRIYSDGVRCLLFEKGLQEEEMLTFVEIASRPSPDDGDDDIVTRMWDAGMSHIAYILAEESKSVLPSDLGAPEASEDAQGRALSTVPRSSSTASRPAPLGPSDPRTVLHIGHEEKDALSRLLEEDERRDTLRDVSAILRSILVTEGGRSVIQETVEILSKLIADFILIEEIDKALCLVESVASALSDNRLSRGHQELLESIPSRIFTAESHESLRLALDGVGKSQRPGLRRLVGLLGTGAAGVLCSFLGDLQNREVRKCVVDGLVETGKDTPAVFLPFLSDERWYLVRNTITILRRIGDRDSLQRVSALSSHPEERVRREVLLAAEEHSLEGSEEILLRFLGDESPALRINALKALGRHQSHKALERIVLVSSSRDFPERHLEERMAWFEAMALIDPVSALPVLRRLLMKRRIFKKKREQEDVSCAIAGLRAMADREALAALIEGTAGRKGEVKALIESAIADMGRTHAQPSRGGEET